MTKSPPILPERKLERVLKIARANSLGVLVCSGASLALSVAAGDGVFAFFSVLALICGSMERQGQRRLRDGSIGGLQWLVGAQGCLYTVLIGYALWRLNYFDPLAHWDQVPQVLRDRFDARLIELGFTPETDRGWVLHSSNVLFVTVLVIVGTFYQGGLALWYALQRKAVAAALYGNAE